MIQHRGLLVAWTIVVGAFLVGIFGGNTALRILPQLGAMVLALITLPRVARRAPLRYLLVYRASLVLLLAAAGTCLIAAGSTAIIDVNDGSTRVAGFVALSTTNLVLTVLAWRALVNPTPRRAAFAGLIAVLVETVAMLIDIIANISASFETTNAVAVMLYASFVATWAGALVCMAAIGAFDRADATAVPEARVVEET